MIEVPSKGTPLSAAKPRAQRTSAQRLIQAEEERLAKTGKPSMMQVHMWWSHALLVIVAVLFALPAHVVLLAHPGFPV